jgi:protease I
MQKKIAMVIAQNGFRDEEYWTPKEIFTANGIQVVTVSSRANSAVSKFGRIIPVDMCLTDIQVSDFDALLFVGGPGTSEYFEMPRAHQAASEFMQPGKLLTAICIAPVILARAGLLQGKKATVFPTGKEELEKAGAIYTGHPVEIEGQLITASGPEAAEAFGRAIVKALAEKD